MKPRCSECDRLYDAYEESTLRYMRYQSSKYNPGECTPEQVQRLFAEMKAAKLCLERHQQEHAFKN